MPKKRFLDPWLRLARVLLFLLWGNLSDDERAYFHPFSRLQPNHGSIRAHCQMPPSRCRNGLFCKWTSASLSTKVALQWSLRHSFTSLRIFSLLVSHSSVVIAFLPFPLIFSVASLPSFFWLGYPFAKKWVAPQSHPSGPGQLRFYLIHKVKGGKIENIAGHLSRCISTLTEARRIWASATARATGNASVARLVRT